LGYFGNALSVPNISDRTGTIQNVSNGIQEEASLLLKVD
jgi:hypothetical protein